MSVRQGDKGKKRIRKSRPRRANLGIKATLNSLLTSDKQFAREEDDLESIDREVEALLRESAPAGRRLSSFYRDQSFEQAELNLFGELMRITLVTRSGSGGLRRTQEIVLHQLGTIIDFIEQRGELGSDIDPLRLLRSSMADLLKGDRAPFFVVQHATTNKKAGRKMFPEYGRQLQYLSTLATQAIKDGGVRKTIIDAARAWAEILARHKILQIDGHDGKVGGERRISSELLLKWREELSADPSYGDLRDKTLSSRKWPRDAESAKTFCDRTAKRLARFQRWTRRGPVEP